MRFGVLLVRGPCSSYNDHMSRTLYPTEPWCSSCSMAERTEGFAHASILYHRIDGDQ
jgi:hypothetical protein